MSDPFVWREGLDLTLEEEYVVAVGRLQKTMITLIMYAHESNMGRVYFWNDLLPCSVVQFEIEN